MAAVTGKSEVTNGAGQSNLAHLRSCRGPENDLPTSVRSRQQLAVRTKSRGVDGLNVSFQEDRVRIAWCFHLPQVGHLVRPSGGDTFAARRIRHAQHRPGVMLKLPQLPARVRVPE